MPKVNYSSRYTENPPRLDRWDGLFLFLGDIFIFTMMISHIENRVKAYMTYLHFFLSKWQALLFQNKENSHASAFVV